MRRRILLLIVTSLFIAAMMPGCTPEAEPAEPVQPGTVAQIPEQTGAPEIPVSTPAPATTSTQTGEPALPPAATTTTPSPPPTTLTTLAPRGEAPPLTVLSVVGGEIQVRRAGEESWQPATTGTTLQPGDTIKAGGGSSAEITFFEGSTIELDALAEIQVSEISVSDTGSTTISLKQQLGRTISRVKKLTDTASSYEIETPAAIAAVRGSTMIINVAANGRTEVANEHGDIRIMVAGQEYLIHEGMKRFIVPGKPPSEEMPMYPSGGGGGGAPPALQSRMEVTFFAEPLQASVGENITYTCRMNNTGDLPFHDIWVSNDISGNATYQSGDANGNAVLDPGETWVFTSVYTLREGDPSPLVATATVSAITSTFVAVVDTETVTTSTLPEPGIGLAKTAEPAAVHVGDAITYTYSVNNTGNTPLSGVSVVDDRLGIVPFVSGDANTDSLLDVGEVWVFSAGCTAGVEDPDLLVNNAIASGTDNLSRTVTASDSASVKIMRTGIVVAVSTNMSAVHVGDTFLYTCQVYNAGTTQLTGVCFYQGTDLVTMVDDVLDVGEVWLIRTDKVALPEDPDLLVYTASASGTDGLSLTVTASDSASVAILRPSISIEVTADRTAAHVGDTITYTCTVTNTGNTPLDGLSLSVRNDCFAKVGGLDVAETWIVQTSHVASSEDPDLLVYSASTQGHDSLLLWIQTTGSASVAILRPGIAIDKTADRTVARFGDTITYTYTVSNTGDTSLSGVSVVDDRLGTVPFISGDTNTDGLLDTGETWVFQAMHVATGDDPELLVNTAIVSGTDELSGTVTASDAASVIIFGCD